MRLFRRPKQLRFLVWLWTANIGLVSCAAGIPGHPEEILIATNPPGATCTAVRQGETIGSIPLTPGTLKIVRNDHALSISCSKPGYETAVYVDQSGVNRDSLGNFVMGGSALGQMVDAATGTGSTYARAATLDLVPVQTSPSSTSTPQ